MTYLFKKNYFDIIQHEALIISTYMYTIKFMVQIETMNEMHHFKIECEDKAHKA